MSSRQRDELVDEAIQKFLSEIEKLEALESSANTPLHADNTIQRHLIYSELLSELDWDTACIMGYSIILYTCLIGTVGIIKTKPHTHEPLSEEDGEVNIIKAGEQESENDMKPVAQDGHDPRRSNEAEDIVKELRVVKRQNFVTHYLVSAMVVLTVAFRLSEVSLILKVKDGMSHPFRFIGSLLFGNVRGRGSNVSQDAEIQQASAKHHLPLLEVVPSVPHLKIPELPHVEFSPT